MASAPNLNPSPVPPLGDDRPVLLRAQGLKKSFGGQVVLDGVDLELRQGEVVLLRGENGSGKTTLLNILTGNLEPDTGEISYLADGTPRTYSFPRRWWQEINPFDHFTPEFVAKEGIGRTWQDVRLFGAQSLRENIAVAEPGHPGENPFVAVFSPGHANRREFELNQRADGMLARLGLADRASSSADMISLGQSKRVAIARAVAAGAKILFLDEPLAGLDRKGIREVLSLLESLVREEELTLVIVEHVFNLSHLHGLVTTDWMLEKGKIKQVDGRSANPFLIRLPSFFNSRPAWFSLLAGDNAEIIDEELPRGATITRIRRPDRWNPEAQPVLEVKGLTVQRGPRAVIGPDDQGKKPGFNLTLYQGEIAILQAPNGWGKSTLFDALAGLLPSQSQLVRLNVTSLIDKKPWEIYKIGMSYMPSVGRFFPSFDVQDVGKLLAFSKIEVSKEISAERRVSQLSGGQLQRLKLATLLLSSAPAKLLCLDEPFNALDDVASEAVAAQIRDVPHDCVLIATPTASSPS